MTIGEMHTEFKISRDGVDSAVYAELLDAEIDFYMNEAMDRYVKTRYGKNNTHRAGFEESQKRTDDLKRLTKSKFAQVTVVPHYAAVNDVVFRADVDTLFDDDAQTIASTDVYQFYVKSTVHSCKDNTLDCCGWQKINLHQQDDLAPIAEDPFNQPKAESPVGFFEDGDLFVWTETGGVIQNVLLTFIKEPVRMDLGTYGAPASVDCELSNHAHKEIVQMAVDIALENLQSPRVQTNEENVQKME
tara:strand:- start:4025 stop:4759 length:735 start_codon:yes stop_codon:yes gene_type:complete